MLNMRRGPIQLSASNFENSKGALFFLYFCTFNVSFLETKKNIVQSASF